MSWPSAPARVRAPRRLRRILIHSVHVLRNHHYKVSVKEVRSEGWPSVEEALKAEPDNRITVLVTDENESVTDIVATRDYEPAFATKLP